MSGEGWDWTLADFRRHVPRIIAERDKAQEDLLAAAAELGLQRDRADTAEKALATIRGAMVVSFPGPDETPAGLMRVAAKRLDQGYDVGGSNMRAAVARVLRTVAALGSGGTPPAEETKP